MSDEDLANAVGGMEGAQQDPPDNPTQPLGEGDLEGYEEGYEGEEGQKGYDGYEEEAAADGDPGEDTNPDNDVWDEEQGSESAEDGEYQETPAEPEPQPEPEPAPPPARTPRAAKPPAQRPAVANGVTGTGADSTSVGTVAGYANQAADKVLAGLVKQVDDLTKEVVSLKKGGATGATSHGIFSPELNAAAAKFLTALATAIEKHNK